MLKGQKCSEATKQLMSLHNTRPMLGKPGYWKGKHLSEESKEKNRQKHLGKKCSEETKKLISLHSGIGMLGKCHTEESKKLMSLHSARKNKPGTMTGIVSPMKGRCNTEETKRKKSEARKNYYLTHGPALVKTYFVSELGHYVRSSWEAKIGLLLKRNNITYSYEQPFSIIYPDNSKHAYFADFTLLDYKIILEPKGWFRPGANNKNKLQLFQKQYPDYKLVVIGDNKYLKLDNTFTVTGLDKVEEFIKSLVRAGTVS